MLLRADDHARSHEAHVRDDLVGREAVAVDEVCADEAASAPEAGFAVDSDAALLVINGFVRERDEESDHVQRWARPVVEDHVFVRYAEGGEVG